MDDRYYWLKIHEHFFDDERILFLENKENGSEYIIFWQKLLLKCLKNRDTENKNYGFLRFTDKLPYTDDLLAKATRTDIDTVRVAIKYFLELDMIEILDDGTYYIEAVNNLIGSESESAERVRKHRALKHEKDKRKALPSNDNVTKSNNRSNAIKEKKEINKERINKESTNKDFTDIFSSIFKLISNTTQEQVNEIIFKEKKQIVALQTLIKKIGALDKFEVFLNTAKEDKWIVGEGFMPTLLLSQYSKIAIKSAQKTNNDIDLEVVV